MRARQSNKYAFFIKMIGIFINFISMLVLIGLLYNIPVFVSVLPHAKPMVADTAICFILSGSLLLLSVNHLRFISRGIMITFATIILLISVMNIVEIIFNCKFLISKVLIQQTSAQSIDNVKSMTFITGINFLVIAFLFLFNQRISVWVGQVAVLFIFFLSLFSFYNYIFLTNIHYAFAFHTTMAIPTTVLFILFCIGFLLLKHDEGIVETVFRNTTGGYYVRRIIPLTFFIPMFIVLLENKMERLNLIEQNIGDVITVAGSFILLSSIVLVVARKMDRDEEKLKSANLQLQQNKKYLQNRDDILRLIEQGKSIREVGEKILKLICQMFNWDLGEIWLVDEEKNVIRFVNSWHRGHTDIDRTPTFHLGEGLPGKIWLEKKHVWIPDYSNQLALDDNKTGLNSAFGMPIIFQGCIFGVMDFYSYQIYTPDEDMLNQMNNMGKLMGEFMYRTHTSEQIQSLSRRDILTGLLNRSALEEDLDKLIHEKKHEIIAVIIVDIDQFKMVNQALGHDQGDFIIKLAAKRLDELIDQNKMCVARLGADKFILYYFNIKIRDEIHDYILQIERAFKQSFAIDHREIFLTISVGITIYPDDGIDSKTLITNADQALANAKKNGGNKSIYFTKELPGAALEELTMHIEMHQAIKDNQFSLSYQPQVNLKTGEICGAEALVRWLHPSKGIVPPGEFISYAEQAGLIVSLNEQIMRMVFQQLNSSWTGPPISVNISAKQFKDKYHLVEYLESLMSEYGVNPKYIELEVTESIIMEDTQHNISLLSAINQLGFKVAIDDFGTGFSSFNYLYRLPAHKIKIDKSFITGLPENKANAEIVKSMIALLHALDRIVVAEGAETAAEIDYLKKEKCDIVQGYYYYKPMIAEDFIGLYRKS